MFHPSWDIENFPLVILYLASCNLQFLKRSIHKLPQFLKPFCNDPQDTWWFHEKHTILDFILGIFWSVLRNFSANQVRRVCLDFLSILGISILTASIIGLVPFQLWSLLFGQKDFLKYVGHGLFKVSKLLLCVINDIVNDFHDYWRVVLIVSDIEWYLVVLLFVKSVPTYHSDEIELGLSLVFN